MAGSRVKTKLATIDVCPGRMMFVQFQVTVPSGFSQSVENERGSVASSPMLVNVALMLAMFHVALLPMRNRPQLIADGSGVMVAGVLINPWFGMVR